MVIPLSMFKWRKVGSIFLKKYIPRHFPAPADSPLNVMAGSPCSAALVIMVWNAVHSEQG